MVFATVESISYSTFVTGFTLTKLKKNGVVLRLSTAEKKKLKMAVAEVPLNRRETGVKGIRRGGKQGHRTTYLRLR